MIEEDKEVREERGKLSGILDTVRDYPEPAEWFIGLLLLGPKYCRHGMGYQVYCEGFEQ